MIIWRFTDGKLGHENQSAGLIGALKERSTIEVYDVPITSLPSSSTLLLRALFRRKIHAFPEQVPDLIVGAGRKTHIPMVVATSLCGGKTVVLMRPSIPTHLFNLVVVPKHDNAQRKNNLIETLGVLNCVQCIEDKNQQQGFILIGGESSHFIWNDEKIVNQIIEITNPERAISWTLTTSRRTPKTFLQRLGDRSIEIVPVEDTDQEWMRDQFAKSGQIWVTPDSVSMVYESLSSGAVTNVFTLQSKKKQSRVIIGLDELINNGCVHTFDQWKLDPSIQKAPAFFNESARVADHILEQLL